MMCTGSLNFFPSHDKFWEWNYPIVLDVFIVTNNLLRRLGPSFTIVMILDAIFIGSHFAVWYFHINQLIISFTSLASMAIISRIIAAFFFTLALAKAERYTGQVLKGSVTCLDCPQGSDLSGVQVLVKCDKVKKLAVAYTEEDGSFQTDLPSDGTKSTSPSNCVAKIMGGPYQLYISTKNSVVQIAKPKGASGHFTTSRPLSFHKTCPSKGKCQAKDMGFASSKTVDLPLPREWGLAPSSYYIPFIPIIGIP